MFYRLFDLYKGYEGDKEHRLPGVKTYKILVKRICQEPWDHQRNDPVRDYSNSGCSPQENWVEVVLNHIKRGATCFYSPFPIRAGKTPAVQISWSHPIVNHLEVKVGDDKQILVDNSSISGLLTISSMTKQSLSCAQMNVRGSSTGCFIHPRVPTISP